MAMSQAHKDALAKGRKEAKALSAYLDSLASRRRGRPVTEDSVKARIARTAQQIAREQNALRRVELNQRKLDLESQLKGLKAKEDRASLERDFIRHAGAYSRRKGISYAAWRAEGVPAEVLRKAGINR